MRHAVAIIFLTAIVLCSVGQRARSQTNESNAAERQVRKMERAWLDAYEKHDMNAMNTIVADDFVITNGLRQTKSQIMDSIKAPPDPANPQKHFTEDVQARVYGNTVILTGLVISEFRHNGKSVQQQMLYTDTYVRHGRRWQVVTSHLSNPDKTDVAVREEITMRHIAGAPVAVIRGGRTVLARGYGKSNVEQSVPASANTIYQIGSTTKPFTAMAIMMLVENGSVSLDDRVAKHLPNLPTQYADHYSATSDSYIGYQQRFTDWQ